VPNLYEQFKRQHIESMSLKELQARMSELQSFLDECQHNISIPNSKAISLQYVIQRVTDVLVGPVDE